MKILIASDHAGYNLKEKLKPWLASLGHEVRDFGPELFDESDDYPDTIHPLARELSEKGDSQIRGIVIGGSGQGEAIVANRYPGVRAAVYYDPNLDIIALSREHNDANVLSLGARFLSDENVTEALTHWLATPFSGEDRHVRRIGKIDR